jgi:hypothetical protein
MSLLELNQGTDSIDGPWSVGNQTCPECKKMILHLLRIGGQPRKIKEKILVWPKGVTSRTPCPKEVPPDVADYYNQACLVLADSPMAAAALARRCLQHVLRGAAKVKPQDLANEIQEVLDRGTLPTHIAEDIDAVRNIGNFAAHPMKSQHTGDILPVEPDEAEWTLNVVEALFDFYYVQPAVSKAKRDALNQKVAQAGKPPLKSP